MLVILGVPNDGYVEEYLMMVILGLPDDGYAERT